MSKLLRPTILAANGLMEIPSVEVANLKAEVARLTEQRDVAEVALKDLIETVEHESKTGLCQGSEWTRVKQAARSVIIKAAERK